MHLNPVITLVGEGEEKSRTSGGGINDRKKVLDALLGIRNQDKRYYGTTIGFVLNSDQYHLDFNEGGKMNLCQFRIFPEFDSIQKHVQAVELEDTLSFKNHRAGKDIIKVSKLLDRLTDLARIKYEEEKADLFQVIRRPDA